MNTCVVWTAFGPKYINEAIFSASSFSRNQERLDTLLLTDKNSLDFAREHDMSGVFSQVICHEYDDEFDAVFGQTKRLDSSKIWFLAHSLEYIQHYQSILYVDSDTYCFNKLSPIWDELSTESDFSICKSPAIRWQNVEGGKPTILSIDDFESTHFSINAGVILFRGGGSIRKVINKWYEEFRELSLRFPSTGNYSINDQGVLKQLILSDSFNYNIISSIKYNATPFIFWPLFKKGLLSDVVIGHSHDIFKYKIESPEELARIPGINTWPYSSNLIS